MMSKLHQRRFGLRRALLVLAACAMAGAVSQPAAAQEAAPLRLELNRLEPVQGEACRVYLLAENTLPDGHQSLTCAAPGSALPPAPDGGPQERFTFALPLRFDLRWADRRGGRVGAGTAQGGA